jgi:copper homeostasis protein
MNKTIMLEICADSIESAIAAERGGADRIELCSALAEGGVTPSSGLMAAVRSRLGLPLCVIIRPRGGDFLYSSDEFEIMRHDVITARQLGADGVVLGILRENGTIDTDRTRTLIEIARPMQVTFHRAFDMSSDLGRALEDVIATGADRILTSGGEQCAQSGISNIAALVKQAAGRIAVMAGAGINLANLRDILDRTGVREIHTTARVKISSRMQYRNERLSMGSTAGREYEQLVTTEKTVSELAAALAQ